MSASTAAGILHRVILVAKDGARAEFLVPAGRSLVKAAAQHGLRITTGCLQGRCAICRAQLLKGAVTALRAPSPNAVGDPAHRADGTVLLCSVGATSDVEIAPLGPWHICIAGE